MAKKKSGQFDRTAFIDYVEYGRPSPPLADSDQEARPTSTELAAEMVEKDKKTTRRLKQVKRNGVKGR